MSDEHQRFSYGTCPAHVQRSTGVDAAQMSSVLRFRLGAHDLSLAMGRGVLHHVLQRVATLWHLIIVCLAVLVMVITWFLLARSTVGV